jgi:hypothetical protein
MEFMQDEDEIKGSNLKKNLHWDQNDIEVLRVINTDAL